MKRLILTIFLGTLFIAISCTEGGVDEHKERQILLSQSQMTFDFEGGEGAFTVTADCTWGAICKADWVEFIQTDGTIGESTLKFSVSRNTSIKERSATMIVTNGAYANIAKEVQIIQSGYVPTLEVVESVSLGGLACEEVIKITSDVEYTVADDAYWLSCEIVAEGIKIAATANTNRDTRRAIVSICAKEDGSVLRRITVSQVTGTGIYAICYTSSDGKVVTPDNTAAFGVNIISNTYENGQGVISFDGPVTEIGMRAFAYCDALTSVTIPDSVTSIGDYAFLSCNALKSVYINDLSAWYKISFQTMSSNPCNKGAKLYVEGVELTRVTIPADITEIRSYTFHGCSSLTSVTIPDSVTKIGSCAFYNTQSLSTITFNGSTPPALDGSVFDAQRQKDPVIYIPSGSYSNYLASDWPSTYKSWISASVNELADGCVIKYTSSDGKVVTPYKSDAFGEAKVVSNRYENGEGLIIFSKPVTEIGERAFSVCGNLTSIIIPNSVTEIGDFAVWNCGALTSVTIPDSVISIGADAFLSCDALKSVTIGNGVTSIGDEAFEDCDALTSVTIGNGVTEIGSSAFYKCNALKSVYINDLSAWCKISFHSNFANPCHNGAKLYLNGVELTKVTIPSDITEIGAYTFCECSSLTSVTIGNGVTSIGRSAFKNCSALTSATIGNSVTKIGYNAFYECSSLTSVTIGNGVTEIGSGAFYRCNALTSATIGNSVTKIGYNAFYECSSLTSIIIPNSVTSIGEDAFNDCTSLTSVTIGNSVTEIGSYAFDDCTSLTSVTIPDSVTEIGSCAFSNCDALTSVTIGNSVTSIGNYAFYDCTSLTSVTIGNSVTEIGSYAFAYCDALTSVTIPDSVTRIGDYAFYGTTSLSTITFNGTTPPTLGARVFDDAQRQKDPVIYIPSGSYSNYLASDWPSTYKSWISASVNELADGCVIKYTSYDGNVVTPYDTAVFGANIISNTYENDQGVILFDGQIIEIGTRAFCDCIKLRSITIPGSVTSIGDYAFEDCYALRSITIPGSVTSIGDYAFQYCDDLERVTIHNGVTSIGRSAFKNCSALTFIDIPDSVTDIGGAAFKGCTSLGVYCRPTTPPWIGSETFEKNPYVTIFVPKGSVYLYEQDRKWDTYQSQILGKDF